MINYEPIGYEHFANIAKMVAVVDCDGEVIHVYPSQTAAAKAFDMPISKLRYHLDKFGEYLFERDGKPYSLVDYDMTYDVQYTSVSANRDFDFEDDYSIDEVEYSSSVEDALPDGLSDPEDVRNYIEETGLNQLGYIHLSGRSI